MMEEIDIQRDDNAILTDIYDKLTIQDSIYSYSLAIKIHRLSNIFRGISFDNFYGQFSHAEMKILLQRLSSSPIIGYIEYLNRNPKIDNSLVKDINIIENIITQLKNKLDEDIYGDPVVIISVDTSQVERDNSVSLWPTYQEQYYKNLTYSLYVLSLMPDSNFTNACCFLLGSLIFLSSSILFSLHLFYFAIPTFCVGLLTILKTGQGVFCNSDCDTSSFMHRDDKGYFPGDAFNNPLNNLRNTDENDPVTVDRDSYEMVSATSLCPSNGCSSNSSS